MDLENVIYKLRRNLDNKINNKKEIGETKVNFVFPKKEKYIGSHIKSKLGDEYASNKSYEEYYKDLI